MGDETAVFVGIRQDTKAGPRTSHNTVILYIRPDLKKSSYYLPSTAVNPYLWNFTCDSHRLQLCSYLTDKDRDLDNVSIGYFPGNPVVRTPRFHCRGNVLDP